VQYQLSRDPRWTRAVYDAIVGQTIKVFVRADRNTTTVTVSGPCPNCGHDFTDTDTLKGPVDTGGVLGDLRKHFRPFDRRLPAVLPPAVLRCTCDENHPDRPDGVRGGCGIRFKVTAARDGDAS